MKRGAPFEPNREVVVVPNTGHFVMLDDPDRLFAAIDGFLARHEVVAEHDRARSQPSAARTAAAIGATAAIVHATRGHTGEIRTNTDAIVDSAMTTPTPVSAGPSACGHNAPAAATAATASTARTVRLRGDNAPDAARRREPAATAAATAA